VKVADDLFRYERLLAMISVSRLSFSHSVRTYHTRYTVLSELYGCIPCGVWLEVPWELDAVAGVEKAGNENRPSESQIT
jgi:hypothetical protein